MSAYRKRRGNAEEAGNGCSVAGARTGAPRCACLPPTLVGREPAAALLRLISSPAASFSMRLQQEQAQDDCAPTSRAESTFRRGVSIPTFRHAAAFRSLQGGQVWDTGQTPTGTGHTCAA